LRSGEQKTLLKLITGSGKTLIASHILRNSTFKIIVCVAPLRCSVEQLHERISPFLPDHASILVDTDGCTDISQLKTMLEGAQWAIFTTFASFVDIIPKLLSASCFLAENTFLLIDEVHNAVNNVTLCELANAFKHSLYLSATVPEELAENLDFDEVFSYNIRTAIEEGVCVDYEVFVPYIENFEFENEPTRVAADLRTKAMYLATGILRTGKRRCIVYLSNIQESLAFEREIVSVFDEYHGITIDTFQMNCNTAKTERQAMLHAFGSSSHYDRIRIIANVRILNEAVDIVPCDSVFISKVGDSTNDITTVQRLGRALRKDIHNPCKVAALFLWCDDYNDTLKSLQLLKQEDIEFHSKVRLLNGCYDNTSKDRASVEEKEKKFTRFVEVKCLTLDEMWETRRQRWICEYEKKGKTPSEKSKDPDEKRAGQWQANMRQKYKNNTLPPDLLALIEATDGWEWEQVDPFEANLEKWVCEYEKKGKTPSEKSKDPEEKSAGIWQSHMRQNYRKGILTAERIAKLELNEGWKWNSHNPFEHYLEQWIVEYEKKRKTPSATSKDPEEKRAGQWQSQMRFAYKAQKLTTERIAKLEENEGWEWEQDDPFEANLENWTREFSKKRKTPSGHSKDAEEKRAGNWQNQMRHKYKNGRLLPERVAKLEAKEGWKWSK
jgi:superfamily II DNA or RNA helicase